MKDRVTLLLLTCGTNACYHVSKRLKECFGDRIRIVGTDINKEWMISTGPSLDAFYQCPLSADQTYYPFIKDICAKEHVDYIMPSFDADQRLFYKGNTELDALGVTSLGISEKLLKIYASKEATNEFLISHQLHTPKCYRLEEIETDKEYFCKPRNGVGSIGARKMKGSEIIAVHDPDLLIEEICHEPEVTLECFNFNGQVYTVARERLGISKGVCTKTRVYYDEHLTSIAQKFADCIELPYIFNLQFMKGGDGGWKITDVNLRTAGGMSLSYAAGWDEVVALGKIMLEEDNVVATVAKKTKEQYVIRAYTDIVTKQVEKRIAFDLDGTLLDSRKRHQVVMDYVLSERNISLDTSDLVSYKSAGENNLSWLQHKGVEKGLAREINDRWIELIEQEKFLVEDDLYPDAKEILDTLSKDNSLILLTARNNREGVMKQIERLGIKQYFDEICVVETSKQTPLLKSKILSEKNINEFHGDTESDMEAAFHSGCQFYATTRGFRSINFWNNLNVDYSRIIK